jgi:hypothetical protein
MVGRSIAPWRDLKGFSWTTHCHPNPSIQPTNGNPNRQPPTQPPGDYTPDLRALLAADIIIATPEKWDGISRNWQTRGWV